MLPNPLEDILKSDFELFSSMDNCISVVVGGRGDGPYGIEPGEHGSSVSWRYVPNQESELKVVCLSAGSKKVSVELSNGVRFDIYEGLLQSSFNPMIKVSRGQYLEREREINGDE